MMQTRQKIALAGATGRLGHHVVDVLKAWRHDVVPMARSLGVDVVTGEGLATALADVECVIDGATGPSPEQEAATTSFTSTARTLHEAGQRAGVRRMIVVSIIGTDRFRAGYNAAKSAHERAMLSGPIPVEVLRAAQFHEFVAQLVDWGTQGQVSYVPKMRTQLVAAKAVAEVLADQVTEPRPTAAPLLEVAGPRPESLVEMAMLLSSRSGHPLKIEGSKCGLGLRDQPVDLPPPRSSGWFGERHVLVPQDERVRPLFVNATGRGLSREQASTQGVAELGVNTGRRGWPGRAGRRGFTLARIARLSHVVADCRQRATGLQRSHGRLCDGL
jgi:uncharacterized protein YbjT (DUF2867 family)